MAKRSRMRRSYLKRFSADFINAYQGIDPIKYRTYTIFNNRSRVQSTEGGRSNMTPLKDNTWTQEVPKTQTLGRFRILPNGAIIRNRNLTPKEEYDKNKKPIFTLETLHETWQSDRHQGHEEFHYSTRRKLHGYELRLYFSGMKFRWVEIWNGTTKMSCVYTSRERAESAYDNHQISWQYVI